MINYRALTGFFLRVALGAIFVYFGVQALLQPDVAMSYIPAYAEALFANTTFMYVWGAVETIVGLMLILGVFTRYAAFAAAALLVPIILAVGLNEVAYRDIVILFAALHLAFDADHLWAIK